MKKFSLITVFLFFTVVMVTGCTPSRKIPKDFDYGSWTGSTYKNDFFGFSITVPESWHIFGKEKMKTLIQEGMKKTQDANLVNEIEMKKMAKSAEITSASLFLVIRYLNEEVIEKKVSNSSITLGAENLSLPGKKIDRAKYVDLFRQNLAKAMPGAVIKTETSKMLGGREFTSLNIEYERHGIHIYEEYLICLKNDFAVLFSLTWTDDSDKKQLDAVMETLAWK